MSFDLYVSRAISAIVYLFLILLNYTIEGKMHGKTEEAAGPSGQGVGLAIQRSRVRVRSGHYPFVL